MSKYIVTETTLNATLYCSTRTLINNDLYGGCFIVLAILASTSCVGQQHHRPIAIPRTFGLVSKGLPAHGHPPTQSAEARGTLGAVT